jgi:hypothetical protein
MAWYDTGTVSVTNGSTAVTGSGTNFISGAQIGEAFYGPDGRLYEIQAIVSATSLTLADSYLGSTQSGQAYKIVPTQSLVATLAAGVSELITDFQTVKDEAGAGKFNTGTAALPGITFNLDQDTGFSRPAANQIGFSTAGVQRLLLTSTGLTSNVGFTGTTGTFSGNVTVQDKIIHLDDTNTAIRFPAADTVTVETNGAERLRVDSTGNVGIGTDDPGARLDVLDGGSTLSTIRLSRSTAISQSDDSAGLGLYLRSSTNTTNSTGQILNAISFSGQGTGRRRAMIANLQSGGTTTGGDIAFYTSESESGTDLVNERMRITNEGNVGIGTTTPLAKLTISGDANTTYFIGAGGGGLNRGLRFTSALVGAQNSKLHQISAGSGVEDNGILTFATNENERMRISTAGNVGIGTTTPATTLDVNGQISGKFTNVGTNVAAQALATNHVSQVTISANTTLTTTVPPAGSTATVIIVTSGTTSRTVTFGTGFASTGTLATGATADRRFVVAFVSDGTRLLEVSRTTAITV